jgi:hypothetical protein
MTPGTHVIQIFTSTSLLFMSLTAGLSVAIFFERQESYRLCVSVIVVVVQNDFETIHSQN